MNIYVLVYADEDNYTDPIIAIDSCKAETAKEAVEKLVDGLPEGFGDVFEELYQDGVITEEEVKACNSNEEPTKTEVTERVLSSIRERTYARFGIGRAQSSAYGSEWKIIEIDHTGELLRTYPE